MKRLAGVVALVFTLSVAACTGGDRHMTSDLAAMERGDVLVQVDNDRSSPVTVYGVKGGAKWRIGWVSAMNAESFWVSPGDYEGGTVDYLLQPTGTRNSRVYTETDVYPWGEFRYLMTGDPLVDDNSVVELRLQEQIEHSYIWVR
jgi:hypothetical protein